MNTVSFHASSSREDVSYNANLARNQVEAFFPLLGEISRPKIREFEIRTQEKCVLNQSATISSDPMNLLVDRFHRVAFRGEGLGNALAPVSSRASLDHAGWV
jgi:predicted Zn-dependent peptidase